MNIKQPRLTSWNFNEASSLEARRFSTTHRTYCCREGLSFFFFSYQKGQLNSKQAAAASNYLQDS